jgi:hypothetical protein
VASGALGWKFFPASALSGGRWTAPGYNDSAWPSARAPFRDDLDLRAALLEHRKKGGEDPGVCFRLEFRLPAAAVRSAGVFELELTTTDPAARVWVNGKELRTEERMKRGKRLFPVAGAKKTFRSGRNVIAVQAVPTPPASGSPDVLMDLRLDEVRRPDVPTGMTDEVSEKMVTERAVVCDLCSSQFGQRPACVTACPHDAAMRVDARFEFPRR